MLLLLQFEISVANESLVKAVVIEEVLRWEQALANLGKHCILKGKTLESPFSAKHYFHCHMEQLRSILFDHRRTLYSERVQHYRALSCTVCTYVSRVIE